MLQYLRKIFGSGISAEPFSALKGLPFYLSDGYTFEKYSWDGNSCVVLAPVDPDIRLPQLKKHYESFIKYCDIP